MAEPGRLFSMVASPGFTAPVSWPEGEWTSVRIDLLGDRAAMFEGAGEQPALVVPRLARSDTASGIGFWTFMSYGDTPDSSCVAHVANLRVVPGIPRYQFAAPLVPQHPPGLITRWEVRQRSAFQRKRQRRCRR